MPEVPSPRPLEVSVQETQRLIAAGDTDLRLIDVRDPDEYEYCRLPGAELIPLPTVPTQAPDRLPDKAAEIIVYCHHGMRSARAAEQLRQVGYANARSMAGGIEQWSREIDSTVPRY